MSKFFDRFVTAASVAAEAKGNEDVKYFIQLESWASRINYASIASNDDAIKEVVCEINRFYHCYEGQSLSDKIEAL